jgi:hypothetical protein
LAELSHRQDRQMGTHGTSPPPHHSQSWLGFFRVNSVMRHVQKVLGRNNGISDFLAINRGMPVYLAQER